MSLKLLFGQRFAQRLTEKVKISQVALFVVKGQETHRSESLSIRCW